MPTPTPTPTPKPKPKPKPKPTPTHYPTQYDGAAAPVNAEMNDFMASGALFGGAPPPAYSPAPPPRPLAAPVLAVPTSLGAATAQAALRPAAVEVRKYWTELEDKEILRRHTPHAKRHTPHATRHAPRATRHTPRAPAP
eukprot:scaffold22908_cov73-Phaeocystis_antarctica.AAC.2